jgi:S1-C subfamily serine protease
VNLKGDLVGINSLFYSPSNLDSEKRNPTPSGVNFAIAAPLAKSVTEGLRKDGKIRRAYLGAELQTLTPGIAAMFSIPEKVTGVVVVFIVRGGPAAEAGLKPKDVITALDGKTVKSSVELERTIIFSPPGKTVEMNLYRDGEKLSMKVALGERPEQKKEEESGDTSK